MINVYSIEHTFIIDCRESVKFYSQIISWFNHCQDTAITLSNEIHHVNDMLSGPVRRRLDLLITLVKQYIYSAKHLQKELSLDELVKKINFSMEIGKMYLDVRPFFNITFLAHYLIK